MRVHIHLHLPRNVFSLSCLLLAGLLNVSGQNVTERQSAPQRVIEVNYAKVKGRHNTFFREVVGAGRAAEGCVLIGSAIWQSLIANVVSSTSAFTVCCKMKWAS